MLIRFDLFEPLYKTPANRTAFSILVDLLGAVIAETKVVTRLNNGADLFREADDAVIILTTPTIDVIELSHLVIEL